MQGHLQKAPPRRYFAAVTQIEPGGDAQAAFHDDRAALRAACQPGTGLCTITGIDGSYSRRLGAQLAVGPGGQMTGSLADGCLERQLVTELRQAGEEGAPAVHRFGAGSAQIDFRLPCGSGIDVLIDPAPDREACRRAIAALDSRRAASLHLPGAPAGLAVRHYIPSPRLLVFGEGPEQQALLHLAAAAGVAAELPGRGLTMGEAPAGHPVDPWTAIVLLYHDHEWEGPLLRWALATPAFMIGAQGGARTRAQRLEQLSAEGVSAGDLTRITSPIGLIPRSREPLVLAMSVLAEIVGRYEQLHPHG